MSSSKAWNFLGSTAGTWVGRAEKNERGERVFSENYNDMENVPYKVKADENSKRGALHRSVRDNLLEVDACHIPPPPPVPRGNFGNVLNPLLLDHPADSLILKIQDPLALVDPDRKDLSIVGELFAMCSEDEMLDKQKTSTANDLERLNVRIPDDKDARMINSYLAVKSFQRSDASKQFKSQETRSAVWCRKTVHALLYYFLDADVLKKKYLYERDGQETYSFVDIYNFMRDRLRAIWQELTVQHCCKHRAYIECLEISFRFLILGDELLCEKPREEFDSTQCSSLMTTCLDKLMTGYSDARYFLQRSDAQAIREKNPELFDILVFTSSHEAEFWVYKIVLSMSIPSESGILDITGNMPLDISKNEKVKFAMQVHKAFRTLNVRRYFQLLLYADYFTAALMNKYASYVRAKYLRVLWKARLVGKKNVSMSLKTFIKQFGFEYERKKVVLAFMEDCELSICYPYANDTPYVDYTNFKIPKDLNNFKKTKLTMYRSFVPQRKLETMQVSRQQLLDPDFPLLSPSSSGDNNLDAAMNNENVNDFFNLNNNNKVATHSHLNDYHSQLRTLHNKNAVFSGGQALSFQDTSRPPFSTALFEKKASGEKFNSGVILSKAVSGFAPPFSSSTLTTSDPFPHTVTSPRSEAAKRNTLNEMFLSTVPKNVNSVAEAKIFQRSLFSVDQPSRSGTSSLVSFTASSFVTDKAVSSASLMPSQLSVFDLSFSSAALTTSDFDPKKKGEELAPRIFLSPPSFSQEVAPRVSSSALASSETNSAAALLSPAFLAPPLSTQTGISSKRKKFEDYEGKDQLGKKRSFMFVVETSKDATANCLAVKFGDERLEADKTQQGTPLVKVSSREEARAAVAVFPLVNQRKEREKEMTISTSLNSTALASSRRSINESDKRVESFNAAVEKVKKQDKEDRLKGISKEESEREEEEKDTKSSTVRKQARTLMEGHFSSFSKHAAKKTGAEIKIQNKVMVISPHTPLTEEEVSENDVCMAREDRFFSISSAEDKTEDDEMFRDVSDSCIALMKHTETKKEKHKNKSLLATKEKKTKVKETVAKHKIDIRKHFVDATRYILSRRIEALQSKHFLIVSKENSCMQSLTDLKENLEGEKMCFWKILILNSALFLEKADNLNVKNGEGRADAQDFMINQMYKVLEDCILGQGAGEKEEDSIYIDTETGEKMKARKISVRLNFPVNSSPDVRPDMSTSKNFRIPVNKNCMVNHHNSDRDSCQDISAHFYNQSNEKNYMFASHDFFKKDKVKQNSARKMQENNMTIPPSKNLLPTVNFETQVTFWPKSEISCSYFLNTDAINHKENHENAYAFNNKEENFDFNLSDILMKKKGNVLRERNRNRETKLHLNVSVFCCVHALKHIPSDDSCSINTSEEDKNHVNQVNADSQVSSSFSNNSYPSLNKSSLFDSSLSNRKVFSVSSLPASSIFSRSHPESSSLPSSSFFSSKLPGKTSINNPDSLPNLSSSSPFSSSLSPLISLNAYIGKLLEGTSVLWWILSWSVGLEDDETFNMSNYKNKLVSNPVDSIAFSTSSSSCLFSSFIPSNYDECASKNDLTNSCSSGRKNEIAPVLWLKGGGIKNDEMTNKNENVNELWKNELLSLLNIIKNATKNSDNNAAHVNDNNNMLNTSCRDRLHNDTACAVESNSSFLSSAPPVVILYSLVVPPHIKSFLSSYMCTNFIENVFKGSVKSKKQDDENDDDNLFFLGFKERVVLKCHQMIKFIENSKNALFSQLIQIAHMYKFDDQSIYFLKNCVKIECICFVSYLIKDIKSVASAVLPLPSTSPISCSNSSSLSFTNGNKNIKNLSCYNNNMNSKNNKQSNFSSFSPFFSSSFCLAYPMGVRMTLITATNNINLSTFRLLEKPKKVKDLKKTLACIWKKAIEELPDDIFFPSYSHFMNLLIKALESEEIALKGADECMWQLPPIEWTDLWIASFPLKKCFNDVYHISSFGTFEESMNNENITGNNYTFAGKTNYMHNDDQKKGLDEINYITTNHTTEKNDDPEKNICWSPNYSNMSFDLWGKKNVLFFWSILIIVIKQTPPPPPPPEFFKCKDTRHMFQFIKKLFHSWISSILREEKTFSSSNESLKKNTDTSNDNDKNNDEKLCTFENNSFISVPNKITSSRHSLIFPLATATASLSNMKRFLLKNLENFWLPDSIYRTVEMSYSHPWSCSNFPPQLINFSWSLPPAFFSMPFPPIAHMRTSPAFNSSLPPSSNVSYPAPPNIRRHDHDIEQCDNVIINSIGENSNTSIIGNASYEQPRTYENQIFSTSNMLVSQQVPSSSHQGHFLKMQQSSSSLQNWYPFITRQAQFSQLSNCNHEIKDDDIPSAKNAPDAAFLTPQKTSHTFLFSSKIFCPKIFENPPNLKSFSSYRDSNITNTYSNQYAFSCVNSVRDKINSLHTFFVSNKKRIEKKRQASSVMNEEKKQQIEMGMERFRKDLGLCKSLIDAEIESLKNSSNFFKTKIFL